MSLPCSNWRPADRARSPRSANLVPPQIGVITRLGEAHLGRLRQPDRSSRTPRPNCSPRCPPTAGPCCRATTAACARWPSARGPRSFGSAGRSIATWWPRRSTASTAGSSFHVDEQLFEVPGLGPPSFDRCAGRRSPWARSSDCRWPILPPDWPISSRRRSAAKSARSATPRSSTTPTTPVPPPCGPRLELLRDFEPPADGSWSAATCASWATAADEFHRQIGRRSRHALRRRPADGLRRTCRTKLPRAPRRPACRPADRGLPLAGGNPVPFGRRPGPGRRGTDQRLAGPGHGTPGRGTGSRAGRLHEPPDAESKSRSINMETRVRVPSLV